MAQIRVDDIRIEAIYSCVPKNTVRTSDYKYFSEVETKMFEKTTGICERRVALSEITCSDLCYEAARKMLDDLGIDKLKLFCLFRNLRITFFLLPQ